MPATYEPIATYTIPSAQANYTFSSIPSTYTDLICVVNGNVVTSADASFYFRFNSDTGTNYSYTRLEGNGTSATSYRSSNDTAGSAGFIGNTGNPINTLHVMNYANTTTYKTTIARGNNSNYFAMSSVSLWRSTAAVTSITFFSNGGNLSTGMTLTLYGIKAA